MARRTSCTALLSCARRAPIGSDGQIALTAWLRRGLAALVSPSGAGIGSQTWGTR